MLCTYAAPLEVMPQSAATFSKLGYENVSRHCNRTYKVTHTRPFSENLMQASKKRTCSLPAEAAGLAGDDIVIDYEDTVLLAYWSDTTEPHLEITIMLRRFHTTAQSTCQADVKIGKDIT